MKVLVMGAGAVGCYYGAMLARAGHALTLVGRPALVDAVNRDGLKLESAAFTGFVPARAVTSPEGDADADLVLFCVKSDDTEKAGAQLAPILDADAVVVSLQNGVDNAERLSAVLGRHVIPSGVYVGCEMSGPGRVRHNGRGELLIGPSPQSERIAAALTAAKIPTQVSPDILSALWSKLIINCTLNALSAIPHAQYGYLWSRADVRDVIRDVIGECHAVAKAAGVALPPEGDSFATVQRVTESMPAQYSSTAQDLAAGKRSEIDHLNGYVVRKGEALGVPTPANRVLQTLVHLRERAPSG